MCRLLSVARSGYYKWLENPKSDRQIENEELVEQIEQFFEESFETYGSPRITVDLNEAGYPVSENRVARLMRQESIAPIRKYAKYTKKFPHPVNSSLNKLQRRFDVKEINKVWVGDITQIQTYEGWLYLAIVQDLCFRKVVGYAMESHMQQSLVIDSLAKAVYSRNPTSEVMIHTDQGSQYGSDSWMRFCRDHNLVTSMSRRGNCHDNAVVESFNSTIKKELIKKKVYKTRADARSEIFHYIEVFYNPKRRHSYIGHQSPDEFERNLKTLN